MSCFLFRGREKQLRDDEKGGKKEKEREKGG